MGLHEQMDILETCQLQERVASLNPDASPRDRLAETFTQVHGRPPKKAWLDRALADQDFAVCPTQDAALSIPTRYTRRTRKIWTDRLRYVRPVAIEQWKERTTLLKKEQKRHLWWRRALHIFFFCTIPVSMFMVANLFSFPVGLCLILSAVGLFLLLDRAQEKESKALAELQAPYEEVKTLSKRDWARLTRWPVIAARLVQILEGQKHGDVPLLEGDIHQIRALADRFEKAETEVRLAEHLKTAAVSPSPVPHNQTLFGPEGQVSPNEHYPLPRFEEDVL